MFSIQTQAMGVANKTKIKFSPQIKHETVKLFFLFAIDEYEYANYGFSKDIFVEILNVSDRFPISNYYLGKIYADVPTFKDEVLAKQYFLKVIAQKNILSSMKQDCYRRLSQMTSNPDLLLKYAKASHKISPDAKSKKLLIMAYNQKYGQTRDRKYLEKANIVTQAFENSQYITTKKASSTVYTGK